MKDDTDDDDDDGDDEDDRKKQAKPKKAAPGFFANVFARMLGDLMGRLIGVAIVGVLFLSCCCCGVGIAVFFPWDKDKDKENVVAGPNPKDIVVAGPNPDAGLPIASPARGKVLLNEKARLTRSDPRDPEGTKQRMKVFKVELQANTTYVISMNSTAFDAYLRLEDPTGREVAEDDDSGGNRNARIMYSPTQRGTFRVIATSFHEGDFGEFQLTVQERDGPKDEPKDKKDKSPKAGK